MRQKKKEKRKKETFGKIIAPPRSKRDKGFNYRIILM